MARSTALFVMPGLRSETIASTLAAPASGWSTGDNGRAAMFPLHPQIAQHSSKRPTNRGYRMKTSIPPSLQATYVVCWLPGTTWVNESCPVFRVRTYVIYLAAEGSGRMNMKLVCTAIWLIAAAGVLAGCSAAEKPVSSQQITELLLNPEARGKDWRALVLAAGHLYPDDPAVQAAIVETIVTVDRRGYGFLYGNVRPLAASHRGFIARIPGLLKTVKGGKNFEVLALALTKSACGRDYVPELQAMLATEHDRERQAVLRFALGSMGSGSEQHAAWLSKEVADHTEAGETVLTLGVVAGFGDWASAQMPGILDADLAGKHGEDDRCTAALVLGASGWGSPARKEAIAQLLAKARAGRGTDTVCYAYALRQMSGSSPEDWAACLRVIGDVQMDHTVTYMLDLVRAGITPAQMREIEQAATDPSSRAGAKLLRDMVDDLDGKQAEKRVRKEFFGDDDGRERTEE